MRYNDFKIPLNEGNESVPHGNSIKLPVPTTAYTAIEVHDFDTAKRYAPQWYSDTVGGRTFEEYTGMWNHLIFIVPAGQERAIYQIVVYGGPREGKFGLFISATDRSQYLKIMVASKVPELLPVIVRRYHLGDYLEFANDQILEAVWQDLCHTTLVKFHEHLRELRARAPHVYTPEMLEEYRDKVKNILFRELSSYNAARIRDFRNFAPRVYDLPSALAHRLDMPRINGVSTSLGTFPHKVKRELAIERKRGRYQIVDRGNSDDIV
jgi:hypothetical protein